SSICANKGSTITDLPPGNSGSFSIIDNQFNLCSQSSNCANDPNNSQGSSSQRNVCHFGSLCSNSGIGGNLNECLNGAVCTNSGDANIPNTPNSNRCLNGAVCTNSGQNTNVQADGAVSCSSGAPGTT